jgi:hypothetical protein
MDTNTATGTPVTHSRIADARRRTRAIKTVAAWVAVAAFTFTAILARTVHPGAASHSGSTTGSLAPPQRLTDELSSSFLSAGEVGPSDASGAAAHTSTS